MSSAKQLLDALIEELEFATRIEAPVSSSSAPEEKKEKPKGRPAPLPPAPVAAEELNINSLELRVGRIVSVYKHETADKLYCEMIDVGEAEPRAIASGLAQHYTLEQMQGRRLIVVCNLKPRNLVGFKSNGMVLCAAKKNEETGVETVEFVDPPESAAIGERVIGEGLTNAAISPSQVDKKKAFEVIGADLRVDNNGVAHWKNIRLLTADTKLPSVAPTLRDAVVR
jgi:aminoacyl tRNA synthase complex-interacting multifunctional protein 1